MPVLFVSHGSPELAWRETAAQQFLKRPSRLVVRPRAILMISAHWETACPSVATDAAPETIYDFGAFDPRLRQMVYSAPRACALTEAAVDLLARASFDVQKDREWGYDHGVWIPLKLIYPAADIPIAQVSIQPSGDPWHHFRLGQSLRALRDEGILVIASGGLMPPRLLFALCDPVVAAE